MWSWEIRTRGCRVIGLAFDRIGTPLLYFCRRGVAQSGLARSVWDAEVGGPNPLTPTNRTFGTSGRLHFLALPQIISGEALSFQIHFRYILWKR